MYLLILKVGNKLLTRFRFSYILLGREALKMDDKTHLHIKNYTSKIEGSFQTPIIRSIIENLLPNPELDSDIINWLNEHRIEYTYSHPSLDEHKIVMLFDKLSIYPLTKHFYYEYGLIKIYIRHYLRKYKKVIVKKWWKQRMKLKADKVKLEKDVEQAVANSDIFCKYKRYDFIATSYKSECYGETFECETELIFCPKCGKRVSYV